MKNLTPIYSITPFTLLDYPDKIACIVWFAGCNMRCLYCYNPDIVLGKGAISFEKVLQFLGSRKGILDGVVLSGGECTLHRGLVAFLKEIKAMGFLVKLDTNGSRLSTIKKLVASGLIDYIALDFKALPNKFETITGSDLFNAFEQTLSFLINSDLWYEVRTTVHTDLINEQDVKDMAAYLHHNRYKGNYYIQHFVNNVPTLGSLSHSKSLDYETDAVKIVFR